MAETVAGSVFAPGSAELSEAADHRLAAIAAVIRAHPTAHVRIVGHSGGEVDDERLALDRARAGARDGSSSCCQRTPRPIEVEGRGEADPWTAMRPPRGEANRRVVVTIEP